MKDKDIFKKETFDAWMKIRIAMTVAIGAFGIFHMFVAGAVLVKLLMLVLYALCAGFSLRFVLSSGFEDGMWGLAIGIAAFLCFYLAGWPDEKLSIFRFFSMGIVMGLSFVWIAKSIFNMTVIDEEKLKKQRL